MWEEAELQMTIGNEEGGEIPSTCVEYSNEKIIYSDWTMGVGQAVFNTTCLRGVTHSFGFIPGSDTAQLEIDSMVILLKQPVQLSPKNQVMHNYNNVYTLHTGFIMSCMH